MLQTYLLYPNIKVYSFLKKSNIEYLQYLQPDNKIIPKEMSTPLFLKLLLYFQNPNKPTSMNRTNFYSTFILILLSFGCLQLSAQKKKVSKKAAPVITETNLIKNDIRFTSKGFKVSEAYLTFDDESMVPDDNKVALNQNVNMVLIIDKGWTESEGRVYPGSRQVIKLNNGVEILKSEDLFAAFDETGVSPDDARYITLNATVTEIKNKANYVIVNFNVWDKKGSSTISGSYKLYIK